MTRPLNGHINYVELPATNLSETKQFYRQVFGWRFVDYGPEYIAIEQAGLDGGFFLSDTPASTSNGSVLVVLYHADLEQCVLEVQQAGGEILKPIFLFPGGRRFHFSDPNQNELAVWCEAQ